MSRCEDKKGFAYAGAGKTFFLDNRYATAGTAERIPQVG